MHKSPIQEQTLCNPWVAALAALTDLQWESIFLKNINLSFFAHLANPGSCPAPEKHNWVCLKTSPLATHFRMRICNELPASLQSCPPLSAAGSTN